ncbi:hypothetical protein IE53DRAFT_315317 [Violaceomyces palustris]|uniref:Uncharacterized protein n=1 Tax=Violaceomyces palustris TaxID=1673888 RepID=A0ACD0NXW5_9BASI|nr:hypothetical protein IE53DRAFT_315317 [Violaceomyces palustris]
MRICLGEEDPQDPPSDPSSSFPSQQIRTGLDLSSLRLYTRHENFGQDGRGGEERDPLKSWFWETWESMSPLHQRRLLTFVTGSDRFPLSGAKGVGMVITKRDVHHHHHLPLPRSSTCTCTLYLPSYPDRMVTSAKLEKVVELAYQGFGLK